MDKNKITRRQDNKTTRQNKHQNLKQKQDNKKKNPKMSPNQKKHFEWGWTQRSDYGKLSENDTKIKMKSQTK